MAEYLRQKNKEAIQADAFPILCSKCLGSDPNLRMTRSVMGAECKMCRRVYTSYKWRRGEERTQLQTIICNICSRLRNLCQCCLLDLEFSLPAFVRDSFKAAEGRDEAIRYAGQSAQTALYYSEQAARALQEGGRNAHLIQHQAASQRDEIISSALSGSAHDTRQQGVSSAPRPPVDRSVRTVFVGGLKVSGAGRITERHLRRHFEPYGLIDRLRILPKQRCALITYAQRSDAEVCVEALYDRLVILEMPLKIMWAQPKKKKKSRNRRRERGVRGGVGNSLTTSSRQRRSERTETKSSIEAVPSALQVGVGGALERRIDSQKLLQAVERGELPEGLPFLLPPPVFSVPPPPGSSDTHDYESMISIL